MEKKKLPGLVARVLEGETGAYEAIFLETKDNIYFHAKTVLKSEEAAWDAVQDTYIAAFRSLEKLKTPETVELWLGAIAGNLCFHRLRKQNAAAPEENSSSAADIPPRDATDAQRLRFVEERLEALPDMQRTAVLYRYCDGMSLSQIGSLMRCGESSVKASLDAAEQSLALCRDTAELNAGLTPTQLSDALDELRRACTLSPALTLSIGDAIARKCGYSSALRVTSAAAHRREPSRRVPPPTAPRREGAGQPRKAPPASDPARAPSDAAKKKQHAVLLALVLVVLGCALGAFALHGFRKNSSAIGIIGGADGPTAVWVSGPGASAPKQEISSACAQAYMGIVSSYTGRVGVCTSQTAGQGLAYASLLDFDGDGQDELYLYYVDNSFSAENQAYSKTDAGEALLCLHEELWRYDGEPRLIHTQEHFNNGASDSRNTTGRWLLSEEDGTASLVNWHRYTDENGYVNQLLERYTIQDGELRIADDVSARFVVANAARQRRDGFLIEEYYGTDSSHFDDIGYFVEGAVTDGDGHKSYTYEDCQAIMDFGTADIVPVGEWEDRDPVALLKDFYDATKTNARQLIYPDGLGGSPGLAWEVNDIDAFLSHLAQLCTG